MKDNRITIVGNVVAEPDRRATSAGEAVISFRVASTERRFDRGAGRWLDGHTSYFAVSAFRGLAEHALASIHKGDRVVVSGTLRMREWDNGARQGTSADIDAEAIGHDLRFGTTVYRRDAPAAAADPHAAAAPAPAGEQWSAPAGEQWSAPAAGQWPTTPPADAAEAATQAPDWGAPAELVADAADAPF